MNKDFCKLQEDTLGFNGTFFLNDERYWNQNKMVNSDGITVNHAIGHKRFGPGNHILDIEGSPHATTMSEADMDFLNLKEVVSRFYKVLNDWGIPNGAILSGPSGVGWHMEWFSDVDDENTREALERYLAKEADVPYSKDLTQGVGVESAVIADAKRLIRQFGAKHEKTGTTIYKTYVSYDDLVDMADYPFCLNPQEIVYPPSIQVISMPEEIINSALDWQKSVKKSVRSPIKMIDSSFLRKEPTLAFSMKYALPMGQRNNVFMKNMIAGMVQSGMTENSVTNIVERICSFQGMSVRESLGWLNKAMRGQIVYNEGELINWIKRNKMPIRYYPKPMIGDPTVKKVIEPCKHEDKEIVYMRTIGNVMRLDYKCKSCDNEWAQGYLEIDRNMPLVNWRDIEQGLQELSKVKK